MKIGGSRLSGRRARGDGRGRGRGRGNAILSSTAVVCVAAVFTTGTLTQAVQADEAASVGYTTEHGRSVTNAKVLQWHAHVKAVSTVKTSSFVSYQSKNTICRYEFDTKLGTVSVKSGVQYKTLQQRRDIEAKANEAIRRAAAKTLSSSKYLEDAETSIGTWKLYHSYVTTGKCRILRPATVHDPGELRRLSEIPDQERSALATAFAILSSVSIGSIVGMAFGFGAANSSLAVKVAGASLIGCLGGAFADWAVDRFGREVGATDARSTLRTATKSCITGAVAGATVATMAAKYLQQTVAATERELRRLLTVIVPGAPNADLLNEAQITYRSMISEVNRHYTAGAARR